MADQMHPLSYGFIFLFGLLPKKGKLLNYSMLVSIDTPKMDENNFEVSNLG